LVSQFSIPLAGSRYGGKPTFPFHAVIAHEFNDSCHVMEPFGAWKRPFAFFTQKKSPKFPWGLQDVGGFSFLRLASPHSIYFIITNGKAIFSLSRTRR